MSWYPVVDLDHEFKDIVNVPQIMKCGKNIAGSQMFQCMVLLLILPLILLSNKKSVCPKYLD